MVGRVLCKAQLPEYGAFQRYLQTCALFECLCEDARDNVHERRALEVVYTHTLTMANLIRYHLFGKLSWGTKLANLWPSHRIEGFESEGRQAKSL